MKKLPSWVAILILTGLGISVRPHQILTRTPEVARVLNPVLSSYELVRMPPGDIERQIRTTGELRLRFNEIDYYFNLEPHDMRARDYRAVETGPGGVSRTLPPQPVHTFKGVLAGREDTRGRFNLTDGGVEGIVHAPEGWYYVEPLRNYLPGAMAGELVVYRQSDIKPGDHLECGVSLPERLHRGVDQVTARVDSASSTTPTKYEFEIATEADYEYVQALGGSENANREIRGILNQVEGVFQSELLLQLRISFQHTWDTQHDPYTTRNASGLLSEFRNHWNTTSKAHQNYDLAHLWTGRDTTSGSGIASHATVCGDGSSAYSLSGYQTPSRLPYRHSLAAHGIAHNFGATHPREHNPPVSSCGDTIMSGGGLNLTFCEFSRQEIGNYVANNQRCLTSLSITLQPPTNLRATQVSNSRLDLAWRDNSDNETGFLLQQRRDPDYLAGWVVPWVSIATVPANVSRFSVDGLLPGTSYHHRVRAFNGIESSAFSNTVRTVTLGIQAPTGLVAAMRSNSWIYLAWRDNSNNETGFRLYRRPHGSSDWVPVATIPANLTRFTDRGLSPGTHYDYLIQAFNSTEFSNFSNELTAQTKGNQHPPGPGLEAPTKLTATAKSNSRIELTWQDNSSTEMRFRLQSRVDGSPFWEPIGETYTDVTGIGIGGLTPSTTYHFRVAATNSGNYSPFSNEAKATTLAIGIQPPTGLIATALSSSRIRLTWRDNSDNETGFLIQRRLDGSPDWDSITITLPDVTRFDDVGLAPGASYHYRVLAFNGTRSSNFSNEAPAPRFHSRLFLPIVLRSLGRVPDSFFTSELTLTNRGTTTATVNYTYTAAYGGGSGSAVDYLDPGRQRVIPDAIAYLTFLGVPIESSSAGGTLAVDLFNLSSPLGVAATVRVTTPVEGGIGRAGLAYPGLTPDGLLTGPAFITGLRQNSQDRSNVAIQNTGDAGEGSITLRVTVFSGESASAGRSEVLPDRTLPPGGFYQYDGILDMAGFDNGFVKVERVSGTAPYYTYGVINDQTNSDGSFVFPVPAGSLAGILHQTLPVIVETGGFSSELTVTNFSDESKTLRFDFVSDGLTSPDLTARFSLTIDEGEQRIIPDVIDTEMRRKGIAGVRRSRGGLAGALFATVERVDMSGIVIGARTSSSDGRGGQYGLFYPAVPHGAALTTSAWVDGLRQDPENRSNVALVNTGEVDATDSVFDLDIYDGDTGRLVRTITTQPLPARRWRQINAILANHTRRTTQGFVRIRKTSGNNPFLAYGVVNDGGAPRQRSDDGAYVPARP